MCFINLMLMIAVAAAAFYTLAKIFMKGEITAAMERDPAATCAAEVIFTYSGLHALMLYKLARGMKRLSVPFLPRLFSQIGRWVTGIEIHPSAEIGKGLFIDHGMCVVVGETTIIGDDVTMFQGVTLGGTGKEKGKRHPTIGNNVVIGAGAKVLGNIKVGNNVMIGSNSVVLRDVPDDSTVVGVPGRIAKKRGKRLPGGINLDHSSLPDPLQQALERLQHEIDHIEDELGEYHDRGGKDTE